MAIETIVIENRKLDTWKFKPSVGEYGIYQNKIWKVVASYGYGPNLQRTLEREIAKERITLNGEQWKEVKGIVSKDHISI